MNYTPVSQKSENFHTVKNLNWVLKLDGQELNVVLECYKLSNKRKVFLNKSNVFVGHKPYFKDFEWTFNFGKHVLVIQDGKKGSDLMVDGVSFKGLFTKRIERMHKQVEETNVEQGIAKNGKIDEEVKELQHSGSLFSPPISTLDKTASQNYDFDYIFK